MGAYHMHDEYYMERGRLVHLACELHDKSELDERTVAPALSGFLESYKKFLAHTSESLNLELVEKRFYHPAGFCGTVDRVFAQGDATVIVEIKTGTPQAWHTIQVAGYALGISAVYGKDIKGGICLYLSEAGDMPKIQPTKNAELDSRIFMAALTIWQFRDKNNLTQSGGHDGNARG
jgi:hypothetical protein